jgi:hypothetical protein
VAIPKQGEERVDQSGKFGKRQIFAEIKPDTRFYKAEEYISKNTGHCATGRKVIF